jgi:hypothetical protein
MPQRIGLTCSYPLVGWGVRDTVSRRVFVNHVPDVPLKRCCEGPTISPFGPLFCRLERLIQMSTTLRGCYGVGVNRAGPVHCRPSLRELPFDTSDRRRGMRTMRGP